MEPVPTIKGVRVTLRKVKEEDIEDRLAIGRHHEFVHMCGGNTLAEPEYPGREIWEAWYKSCKDTPYLWVIEI